MGSGCFKVRRDAIIPLATERQEALQEHPAALKSVIQLASKASSQVTDSKLDEALDHLSSIDPEVARDLLKDWLANAALKSQTALLLIMQRVIGRALDASVVAAEELVAAHSSGVGDIASVGHIVTVCKDPLSINFSHRSGVSLAIHVLSDAFTRDPSRSRTESEVAASVVPSLDRFVLLLRPSLLAHIENSAENAQHWREFVCCAGLPPLEKHLSLLSCGAKGVVLSLMVVPEGSPPVAVVANRDAALFSACRQLPKEQACVLSPYFEASAGTKVVQGRRVEGGEGHGPRKEFFVAASADAIKKWSVVAIPTPSDSPGSDVQVSFANNRIVVAKTSVESATCGHSQSSRAQRMVSRAIDRGCVGDRIRIEFSNGAEVERIITATHGETGISTSEDFGGSTLDASAVCSCGLQRPVKPMFEFHRGTGQYWFGAYSSELDHPSYGEELRQRYITFGKLLLLALANRCKISFLLPAIFFRLLLQSDVKLTLEDLKDFDSDLHLSLKKCLKMNASNFNSLKEMEGLSEHMSREEYVSRKVKETFEPAAMEEIRKGFWSLSHSGLSFRGVTEGNLRQLLCPVDDLSDKVSIRDIFRVEIEDEMANYEVFVNAFWTVVDSLPLADKKLFLRFFTGLDSLPEPGTERLIIELPFSAFSHDEHLAMLDLLPQAHTCSNTLELPNYYEALKESGRVKEGESSKAFSSALRELLRTKLLMAIRETSGYELDATADRVAPPPPLELEPPKAAASTGPPVSNISVTSPAFFFDPEPPGPVPTFTESPRLPPGSHKVGSDVDTFLAELEMGLEATDLTGTKTTLT